jgi:hypothetical protein
MNMCLKKYIADKAKPPKAVSKDMPLVWGGRSTCQTKQSLPVSAVIVGLF